MRYYEHEGVIYRGHDQASHVHEMLGKDGWEKSSGGHDAVVYGTPMNEAEAREFAGSEWLSAAPPSSKQHAA